LVSLRLSARGTEARHRRSMPDVAAPTASSDVLRNQLSQRSFTARSLLNSSQDNDGPWRAASVPAYFSWQANTALRRRSQEVRGMNGCSLGTMEERRSTALNVVPSLSLSQPREASREEVAPRSYWERNLEGMQSILWHPFSVLLLFFPLGIISSAYGWNVQLTFWMNFLALIPLAKILGDATEELDACLHSEVISGLLNATFGNAVEMIITIQTLRIGLIEVVKATLLGSVLSNLLLVLGMSFLFGGILELGGLAHGPSANELSQGASEPLLQEVTPKSSGVRFVLEKEQEFVVDSALVSVTMLLVSCLSFALPTVFTQAFGEAETVLSISRTAACIVGLSYFAYLFFQLITHRKMLAGQSAEEEDDEEGLTAGFSIGLLALTTILVSISSECLVNVIEQVVSSSGISECFIGIILLPIVGNACEHAAAVRFAIYNKPGLSISIAVGSSVQVALFVVPFAVIMGWVIDQPMTLDFGMLNTTVLVICVLVVMSIVVDGRSNWLEGYMLCSAYALVAVMYWHVHSFGDSSGEF